MKSYYDILEVNPKASEEIIKKVYKIHIKNNHPDLFQGEEKIKAEELIKEINEAYEILIDSDKRKKYDYDLGNNEIEKVLLEENQYLKSVIEDKEQIIKELLKNNDMSVYYKNSGYVVPEAYNNNVYQNYIKDNFEKVENNKDISISKQYLNDLKQFGTKILNIAILITIVGIILFSATGFNIFKIIWNLIKNMW